MKRSGPLTRRTTLRAKAEHTLRRTPLAFRSKKRAAETPIRSKVQLDVLQRDGFRCQLWWHHLDCAGPLDVHEVVRRSQHPGAHLDPALCVTLCRHHHNLDEHRHEAELLGIRVPGSVFARQGLTAIDEAARRRRAWERGRDPGRPSWWNESLTG